MKTDFPEQSKDRGCWPGFDFAEEGGLLVRRRCLAMGRSCFEVMTTLSQLTKLHLPIDFKS
jgi:hypothetical protein